MRFDLKNQMVEKDTLTATWHIPIRQSPISFITDLLCAHPPSLNYTFSPSLSPCSPPSFSLCLHSPATSGLPRRLIPVSFRLLSFAVFHLPATDIYSVRPNRFVFHSGNSRCLILAITLASFDFLGLQTGLRVYSFRILFLSCS